MRRIKTFQLMAAGAIAVAGLVVAPICVPAVAAAGTEKVGHELAEEGLESWDAAADDGHVELDDTPHESRGRGS